MEDVFLCRRSINAIIIIAICRKLRIMINYYWCINFSWRFYCYFNPSLIPSK